MFDLNKEEVSELLTLVNCRKELVRRSLDAGIYFDDIPSATESAYQHESVLLETLLSKLLDYHYEFTKKEVAQLYP